MAIRFKGKGHKESYWLIFGGLWSWVMHVFFGLLLCVTVIGIPWGKQHFKMAALSLAPFGKEVELGI